MKASAAAKERKKKTATTKWRLARVYSIFQIINLRIRLTSTSNNVRDYNEYVSERVQVTGKGVFKQDLFAHLLMEIVLSVADWKTQQASRIHQFPTLF
jgi:hypothetical protein